jgi:hypothetical protein
LARAKTGPDQIIGRADAADFLSDWWRTILAGTGFQDAPQSFFDSELGQINFPTWKNF